MAFLNSKRSSPRSIASTFTPNTWTSYLSKTPALLNSEHRFKADCPPKLGSKASGLSFSMICVNLSTFNGSIYVTSAVSGSVIIVAGLELTKTILYPNPLNALQACVPE